MRRFPLGSWALALALCGCTGGSDPCRVAADCASGVCGTDGTCRPASSSADGGPSASPDAGTLACLPNHDGRIDRDEVPLRAGLSATFRIATDADVDTKGLGGDDDRYWNLDGTLEGDHDVELALLDPAGQWFADLFPTATYFTTLSTESDLLGVFQVQDDALLLLGVVSPEDGLYRTELSYEPAVEVLRFPLVADGTWSTTTEVSGIAIGAPTLYSETYESSVDASGTLDTPYGTFAVQRVHTELTRTVGVAVVTRQTYTFVSECYGPIASLISQDYETDADFTTAAEVRRLTR